VVGIELLRCGDGWPDADEEQHAAEMLGGLDWSPGSRRRFARVAYRTDHRLSAPSSEGCRRPAVGLAEGCAGAVPWWRAADPSRYGKPLRGTLAGYWKLCVEDWRVVYAIRDNEVVVLAIKHRSKIYDEVSNRL